MPEQVDLFAQANAETRKKMAPLAARMRPRRLEDIIGQDHILGPGKLLRRAIETDRLSSLIFWGPPGTGKTTLAQVIARVSDRPFAQLNAVTDGIADLRKLIHAAESDLNTYGKQTILFIDEIHRFNKAQQDGLLPAVEKGIVILIGATTQNPYFSLNPALLSRSMIFGLEALDEASIIQLMKRALADRDRGLGAFDTQVSDEALAHLAHYAQGDARTALNGLELAVLSSPADDQGIRHVDLAVAEESIQRPAVVYDNTGDEHYDIISAFIKSVRGSDAQAAIYYMARMLDAGEDPLFIARRLVILSCEDVGMADPQALVIAQSAADALQFIGMPEGRIILSQACVYLCEAPKSNAAYLAIDKALADVRKGRTGPVPPHLRDAHYKGAKDLGHGKGYRYPHDYPGHYVDQDYLPDNLRGTIYYSPDDTVTNQKGPRQ
ncbi:replication-associated recombination protein A [Peptococcus simiae]|uniref:Replication-associated recombination protein A n=1 Tax=Peptococcus simiae TaxID=1643805 RepID=A0ABW9H033_9FIRM